MYKRQAVEKGKKMDIKRGEIWEISMNGGIREILCIKAFEKYVVGLLLSQEETEENCIMIKSRIKMYADVGRIIYAYNDNIRSYIKTLPENDTEYIMQEIVKTLSLDVLIVPTGKDQEPERTKKSERLVRTEAERDIYRAMYTDLLERVTKI